ncbi:hypothetical protein Hbl1158_16880 (plasmid) [Halobaculum sp. CBA1158]|uniref:hypothetical protein n=1 Tax=Halobaculum sp. CBA1158 TaxID=2904243 RepID=UPI001F2DE0F2|nr:hypothetical protein [Halobaculum sp. CBA1158]UIP01729.1 hypothetical protein Hbl1158_16880 [Halobaculum sp. CBA1158]
MDSDQHEGEDPHVPTKDWSGFVSTMLALATLLVVVLAYLVSMEVAGGFAALFLVAWALYFAHPRIEVTEA